MSSETTISLQRTAWIALLALGTCLALAPVAHAQDASANKKLATDLFDRGVRQMREGRCDKAPVADRATCEAARDALKRAYELYPDGLGALRNLAYVEASLGLVASAARSFRELARRAPHDPSPARRIWADFAGREAEVLAARVPQVEIVFASPPPPHTALLLDGEPLPEAAWRTPLELDPGPHEVRAEAPEHAPYAESFELAQGEHKRVSIALRSEATPALAAEAAHAPESSELEAPARASRARLGPALMMSAGGAALAVGLGFGYRAMSERDAACGDTQSCEPEGLEAGKRAAHVSTALSSVGAAALASGLVWYFVSRKRERRAAAQLAPAVTPGGALLQASGSF